MNEYDTKLREAEELGDCYVIVRYDRSTGVYDAPMPQEPQEPDSWREELAALLSEIEIEDVEIRPLAGWEPWTHAVHVRREAGGWRAELVYFVGRPEIDLALEVDASFGPSAPDEDDLPTSRIEALMVEARAAGDQTREATCSMALQGCRDAVREVYEWVYGEEFTPR